MDTTPDQRGRNGHQLWIALIPLVIGGFLLLSYVLWSAYRDVWAEAGQIASSQSGLLEARFEATLRRIDATLDELAERLPKEALVAAAAPRYRAAIEKDLARQQRAFPEVAGFRVVDASGRVLYLSGGGDYVNLADRPYFQLLQKAGGTELQFSDVVTSRITGRPRLPQRGQSGRVTGNSSGWSALPSSWLTSSSCSMRSAWEAQGPWLSGVATRIRWSSGGQRHRLKSIVAWSRSTPSISALWLASGWAYWNSPPRRTG